MQLAFYAPLKSPDHPVPSGDRQIAQSLMAALSMNSQGLPVTLASTLRCFDGQGDRQVQQQISARAGAEVARLLKDGDRWRAWVTYHNYYKAPDLVGVAVSRRLKIPYMLIEASIARRRLQGPWANFAASADAATEAADVVFYLTDKDRIALEQHRPADQTLVHLAPFLERTDLPELPPVAQISNRLLAVGMHRYGDKLESYRILAAALAYLTTTDWQLCIVGDGPAHLEVKALFESFGSRVTFAGQLDQGAVAAAYRDASVFVWPGVNEAFGMVYLEAQAAGVPVVAQDRAGVREVIGSPHSLVADYSPHAMARAIDATLADPQQYRLMQRTGHELVRRRHLLGAAAATLSRQLALVLER